MNEQSGAVFTRLNDCQDCYRCVRECPVKAIRIADGRAAVIEQMCIACGHCVTICPARAKVVRSDVAATQKLVASNRPVYVSLAPSWLAEFDDVKPAQMVAAIKQLGFKDVGETAIGAQMVNTHTAALLTTAQPGLYLSTACPAAYDYICKYIPEKARHFTPTLSPAQAHASYLKERFGGNCHVVFIGPCVAKKREADTMAEVLDIALTFAELREMLAQKNIKPEKIEVFDSLTFMDDGSGDGARYPYPGGMVEGLAKMPGMENVQLETVDGIQRLADLKNFDTTQAQAPVFVECLACRGGCIGGPCMQDNSRLLGKKQRIQSHVQPAKTAIAASYATREGRPHIEKIQTHNPTNSEIRNALQQIGKTTIADELNCTGCGYASCREFAQAMLRGHAEPAMCLSYMRSQHQRKANALMRSLPAAVVIVDNECKILECNSHFTQLFAQSGAGEAQLPEDALTGAPVAAYFPLDRTATEVLKTAADLRKDAFHYKGRVYELTVFSITAGAVVGAVISDITHIGLKREQIAERAKEVITRNLGTVQNIACMLGEHMAETEILLRDIAENYTGDDDKTD